MTVNKGYLTFMRDIKSLSKKNSFAIVGNEPFFKSEALSALTRALRGAMELDEELFDANERTVKTGTVDDALCEYPLIGSCRFVKVLNADNLKSIAKLSYWFEEPTEDTRVCFVFGDKIKRPPDALTFELVIVCNQVGVESKEFMKYVDFCLEGTGKTLDKKAVEYAKKVFASNLHIMKQELIKASFYVGPAPVITEQDLNLTLAAYPVAKVFDMLDALVARDIRTSMIILEELIDQGVPATMVTHLLSQRLRVISASHQAVSRGERLKEYMIRKRIPLFQFGQVLAGLRSLKEFHIKKFYDILCEYEYRLRGRLGDVQYQRTVSESLVVALCS